MALSRHGILRILLCVCLAIVPFGMFAESVQHVVQRGETWQSICRDYGITFRQLCDNNKWIGTDSDCQAGIEIDIPLIGLDGDRLVNRLGATDSRYIEAQALFDAREYKKAVKIYDRIIKNDVGPYAAMFLRGRAQLMRGKYGQAIDDFNSAEAISFSSLDDLRSQASDLKVEQDERRAAMWSAIALGVAQAGMEITNGIMENEQQKAVVENREKISAQYELVTPAGNVIRPPESMVKLMNGEYNTGMQVTYDQFGNMMFSSEGMARMAEDVARDNLNMAQNSLARNPNSAIAQSTAIRARGDMQRAMQDAQYWRTPHYAPDAETMKEINADIAAQNDRRRKERMVEREADKRDLIDRNKAQLEAMVNHTTSSGRIPSSSSSNTTSASSVSRTNTKESATRTTEQPVLQKSKVSEEDKKTDSHQQFKTSKVSSDDYDEIKKVNLYIQNGSSFNLMFRTVPLCKKGAQMFVKIDGKYYVKMRSNTSRFNGMIVYGAKALYFQE